MPFTTELIDQGTGLLRVWTGEVTSRELLEESANLLFHSPTPDRLTHQLLDYTAVSLIDISVGDVLQVADIDKNIANIIPTMAVALVMPTHVGHFLGSIYEDQMVPNGWNVEVFPTRKLAEAWLDSIVPVRASR